MYLETSRVRLDKDQRVEAKVTTGDWPATEHGTPPEPFRGNAELGRTARVAAEEYFSTRRQARKDQIVAYLRHKLDLPFESQEWLGKQVTLMLRRWTSFEGSDRQGPLAIAVPSDGAARYKYVRTDVATREELRDAAFIRLKNARACRYQAEKFFYAVGLGDEDALREFEYEWFDSPFEVG